MNGLPVVYRAEVVAYQAGPEPRMFHLGDVFSPDVGWLQWSVAGRALEIASDLGRRTMRRHQLSGPGRRR